MRIFAAVQAEVQCPRPRTPWSTAGWHKAIPSLRLGACSGRLFHALEGDNDVMRNSFHPPPGPPIDVYAGAIEL
nr:unnamed protein product [Digitaria exilis]